MRKIKFTTAKYYHIYNRGVEKRKIFQDREENEKFIKGLQEYNTTIAVDVSRMQRSAKYRNVACDLQGERYVDVLCYNTIINHYHLLLRQVREGGITEFMHKLGIGYTGFYNKKHERTGRLFESTFKAKAVENDSYLLHITRYIHLNPLKLIDPNWKRQGIKDRLKAEEFLKNYSWSSYKFFCGEFTNNIIPHDFVDMIIGEVGDYQKFALDWAEGDFERHKDIYPKVED